MNDKSDYKKPRTNLFKLLPEVLQTPVNEAILENVHNRFLTKGEHAIRFGTIGKKNPSVATDDRIVENSVLRQAWQLTPIMTSKSGAVETFMTFEDLLRKSEQLGIFEDRLPQWGNELRFNYAPPVDPDKLINYTNYYWYDGDWDPSQGAIKPQYITIKNKATIYFSRVLVLQARIIERMTAGAMQPELDALSAELVLSQSLYGCFKNGTPGWDVYRWDDDGPMTFFATGVGLESFNLGRSYGGEGTVKVNGIVQEEILDYVVSTELIPNDTITFNYVLSVNDEIQITNFPWYGGLNPTPTLLLPLSVSPGDPVLRYDSTIGKLKSWNGSAWVEVTPQPTGGLPWGAADSCKLAMNDWSAQNKWRHKNDLKYDSDFRANMSKAVQAVMPIIEYNPMLELNGATFTSYKWKYRSNLAAPWRDVDVEPTAEEISIRYPLVDVSVSGQYLKIPGDRVGQFTPGYRFTIEKAISPFTASQFTVVSSTLDGIDTKIAVKETISLGISVGDNIVPLTQTSLGDPWIGFFQHWAMVKEGTPVPVGKFTINTVSVAQNTEEYALSTVLPGSATNRAPKHHAQVGSSSSTFTVTTPVPTIDEFMHYQGTAVVIKSINTLDVSSNGLQVNFPYYIKFTDLVGFTTFELYVTSDLSGSPVVASNVSAVDIIPAEIMLQNTTFTANHDAVRVYVDGIRQYGNYIELNKTSISTIATDPVSMSQANTIRFTDNFPPVGSIIHIETFPAALDDIARKNISVRTTINESFTPVVRSLVRYRWKEQQKVDVIQYPLFNIYNVDGTTAYKADPTFMFDVNPSFDLNKNVNLRIKVADAKKQYYFVHTLMDDSGTLFAYRDFELVTLENDGLTTIWKPGLNNEQYVPRYINQYRLADGDQYVDSNGNTQTASVPAGSGAWEVPEQVFYNMQHELRNHITYTEVFEHDQTIVDEQSVVGATSDSVFDFVQNTDVYFLVDTVNYGVGGTIREHNSNFDLFASSLFHPEATPPAVIKFAKSLYEQQIRYVIDYFTSNGKTLLSTGGGIAITTPEDFIVTSLLNNIQLNGQFDLVFGDSSSFVPVKTNAFVDVHFSNTNSQIETTPTGLAVRGSPYTITLQINGTLYTVSVNGTTPPATIQQIIDAFEIQLENLVNVTTGIEHLTFSTSTTGTNSQIVIVSDDLFKNMHGTGLTDIQFRSFGLPVAGSDNKGIRNWISTLPLLKLFFRNKPHLLADSARSLFQVVHHDSHISDISFSSTDKTSFVNFLLGITQGFTQTSMPTYSNVLSKKAGVYWYNPSTQTLYRLSVVAIDSVTPNVDITVNPVGSMWINTGDGKLYIRETSSWVPVNNTTNDISLAWKKIDFAQIVANVLLKVETKLFDAVQTGPLAFDFSQVWNESSFVQTYLKEEFFNYVREQKLDPNTVDFNASDAFTWNYRGINVNTVTYPNASLQSSKPWESRWQPIYRRLFGTPYPHLEPWKVQGYYNKPDWWDLEYSSEQPVAFKVVSPGIVYWANHRLVAGNTVTFSSTGGLPTGLTAGTTYYVVAPVTTHSFAVSATNSGSAINFTNAGTGQSSAKYGNGRRWKYNAATDTGMWKNIKTGIVPAGRSYPNGGLSTGVPSADLQQLATFDFFCVNIADTVIDGFNPDDVLPPYYTNNILLQNQTLLRNFANIPQLGVDAISATYVFGDEGPVEWKWRNSVDYLYNVMNVAFKMQPVKFLHDSFGLKVNLVNQLQVDTNLKRVYSHKDIQFHGEIDKSGTPVSFVGVNQWYSNYLRYFNYDPSLADFKQRWKEWDVSLSYPTDTFIDAQSLLMLTKSFKIEKQDVRVILKKNDKAQSFNTDSLFVTTNKVGTFNVNVNWKVPKNDGNDWVYSIQTMSPKASQFQYYAPDKYTFIGQNRTAVFTDVSSDNIVLNSSVTWQTGDPIFFTGSNLPAPLLTNKQYYVIVINPTSIRIAVSASDALSNTWINLTTAGASTTKVYSGRYFETNAAHDWVTGQDVRLISSTNVLPFGTTTEKTYFIINTDPANTNNRVFKLAETLNQAITDDGITTISAGGGVLTIGVVVGDYTVHGNVYKKYRTKNTIITQLFPALVTGVQTLVDAITGYADIQRAKGFTFNDSSISEIDVSTGKLVSWDIEIERLLTQIYSGLGKITSHVLTPEFHTATSQFQEVNPFRTQIWFNPPKGVVSNMFEESILGIQYKPYVYNQIGSLFKNRDINVLRKDTQTYITVDKERLNITESNPYNSSHISGLQLFTDEYEHAIVFDDYTSSDELLYDPFLGLQIGKITLSAFALQTSSTSIGRPNLGGRFLSGDNFVANYENSIETLGLYYDTYQVQETVDFIDYARALLGYEPPKYLDLFGVNEKSKFVFWKGVIQAKGASKAVTAFLNSKQYVDAGLDEFWAYKSGEFGDSKVKSYLELNVGLSDVKKGQLRLHFAPGFPVGSIACESGSQTRITIDTFTYVTNCITMSGVNTLLTTASFGSIKPGMVITGSNIPANTVVLSVESPLSLTMSNNASGSASGLTIAFDIGATQPFRVGQGVDISGTQTHDASVTTTIVTPTSIVYAGGCSSVTDETSVSAIVTETTVSTFTKVTGFDQTRWNEYPDVKFNFHNDFNNFSFDSELVAIPLTQTIIGIARNTPTLRDVTSIILDPLVTTNTVYTVSSTNHLFSEGDLVVVTGSSNSAFNGTFSVFSTTDDDFKIVNTTTTGSTPAPVSSFTVTQVTRSGSTATATTSVSHNFISGNRVTIGGTTNFNGAKTITGTTSNTFSFACAGTEADELGLGAGTVVRIITISEEQLATAILPNHQFQTGQLVVISGATQTDYNGNVRVRVLDNDRFAYVVPNAPITPATGIISTSTVLLNFNGGGNDYISFAYPADETLITFDNGIGTKQTFNSVSGTNPTVNVGSNFYIPNTNNIVVYLNGVQLQSTQFTEPSGNQVQITGVLSNAVVVVVRKRGVLREVTHYEKKTANIIKMISPASLASLGTWTLYGVIPAKDKHNAAHLVDIKSKTIVDALTIWDPAKGRHNPIALPDIDLQSYHDQAHYTHVLAPYLSQSIKDGAEYWSYQHNGQVWLDTSNLEYLPYHDKILFPQTLDRTAVWGSLAPWGSANVYQWVESDLSPIDWDKKAADSASDLSIAQSDKITGEARKILYVRRRASQADAFSDSTWEVVPQYVYQTFRNAFRTNPTSAQYSITAFSIIPGDQIDVFTNGIYSSTFTADESSGNSIVLTSEPSGTASIRFSKKITLPTPDQVSKSDPSTSLMEYRYDYPHVEVTRFNDSNKLFTTKFYFWVKNRTTLVDLQRMSAKDISDNLRIMSQLYMIIQGSTRIMYHNTNYLTRLENFFKFTQCVIPGVDQKITEDGRNRIRFLHDLTLRDKWKANLNNVHTQWEMIRPQQEALVPKELWNKVTETILGHEIDDTNALVPAIDRVFYTNLVGGDVEFGLQNGQAFGDKDIILQRVNQEILLTDFDGASVDKDYFLETYPFDSDAHIIAGMDFIYNTFPTETVNHIFFAVVEELHVRKMLNKDIMKTSFVALIGIRLFETAKDVNE